MTFTVTVPAASRALLTLAEIKSALGVTDASRDAELTAFGLAISDMVSAECCVPNDGIAVPTLLQETIVETIRLCRCAEQLILSRRFVSSIASITVDGTALETTDYEPERAAGLLNRLCVSHPIAWYPGTIVVTYTAGFTEIPGPLKRAAITVLREQASADSRDPMTKRVKEIIEGLGTDETEYWVNASSGSSAAGAISSVAAAMLAPYRYYGV